MNQTFFKSLTPALIGAVTVATVGIPQAAQAQTTTAISDVDFTNATLTLDGVDFWPTFFTETQAGAELNNIDPFDSVPPTACDSSPIGSAVNQSGFGGSFARGSANVDCSNPSAIANNDAELALLDTTNNNESGTGLGGYELFNEFEASAGQEIIFNGDLATTLRVITEGYDLGEVEPVVEAEYLAQFNIDQIVDGEAVRVFTGETFDDGIDIINDNDTIQAIRNSSPIPTQSFTFEEDGLYEVRFSAVERVGAVENGIDVPEPSNLSGLLALGGIAFLVKRRNSH